MTTVEPIALIRRVASAVGSRRPAGAVVESIGTAGRAVVGDSAVQVLPFVPWLSSATVTADPDGTAGHVRLTFATRAPLDAFAALGRWSEPFAVNAHTPISVQLIDGIGGCSIWADLDDDDTVRSVLIREG